MPIRFPEPPALSTSTLESAIASRETSSEHLAFLKTARPAWTMPHEVYHLGLNAVETDRGVDAAEPVAWRYVSSEAGKPGSTAADVQHGAGGATFAGLTQAPFVRAFAEAVQRSAADPTLGVGDFEPRLLQIPALYIVALWLKDGDPSRDVFIPLPPANSAVEPGRHYDRKAFEAALAQAASNMRQTPANQDEQGTAAP